MSDTPTVSVILIFFNEERFIEEAVNSVRAQSLTDWELLLCDDGSSDQSTAMAKAFAAKDPGRIRYLEHDGHANKGMSQTRNLGIRNARGEFISFIDGDDVWLPTKLSEQVALLADHPEAGFLCAPAQWWYGWTGNRQDVLKDFIQPVNVPQDAVVQPPDIIISFLNNEFTSLCDTLIRREVIEKIGGYESQFKGLYEDQAFHTKLCLSTPAYQCAHPWYRYRQHPESCCIQAQSDNSRHEIREQFLTWMENYLDEEAVGHRGLRRALRWQLLPYRKPGLAKLISQYRNAKGRISSAANSLARAVLPMGLRNGIGRLLHYKVLPPLRWHCFALGRRSSPYSHDFAFDRGKPIDRYYIEKFLDKYSHEIKGRVLEIADDAYTRVYGGDKVTHGDILHSPDGSPTPKVTILDDLRSGEHLQDNYYDCLIVTQTLLFIYELDDTIRTMHRCLKPGGVLLLTLPGISQIIRGDAQVWGHYWCFTRLSTMRLLAEQFPEEQVKVQTYGNALSACGFLMGLATEEMSRKSLEAYDENYPLIIGACARKAEPT